MNPKQLCTIVLLALGCLPAGVAEAAQGSQTATLIGTVVDSTAQRCPARR